MKLINNYSFRMKALGRNSKNKKSIENFPAEEI